MFTTFSNTNRIVKQHRTTGRKHPALHPPARSPNIRLPSGARTLYRELMSSRRLRTLYGGMLSKTTESNKDSQFESLCLSTSSRKPTFWNEQTGYSVSRISLFSSTTCRPILYDAFGSVVLTSEWLSYTAYTLEALTQLSIKWSFLTHGEYHTNYDIIFSQLS